MATLQILGDDSLFPLNLSQLGIGRARDNEIFIEDEAVSSYHALVTIRESPSEENSMDYIIEDLDSTNKTYVNNKEISKHALQNGDIIRVGETRIKFSTKEYVPPPEDDFQKTKKLTKKQVSSFMYKR